MAFMGLNPEKARTLSSVLRQTGAESEDLSAEVRAALTLSELDSPLPGQLVFTGDELKQLGLIIAARVDIAEGLVIDPEVLAAGVGITIAQAETAIAAFAEPDARPKQLTPFLDALTENKRAAEILRSSFVNLPAIGADPAIDQALLRLGTWLPVALEAGERPDLTDEQVLDLETLAGGLELSAEGVLVSFDRDRPSGFGVAIASAAAADGAIADVERSSETLEALGRILFDRVSQAFELDSRLRSAAGLPTLKDLFDFQLINESERLTSDEFDERFNALDDWLPAYLAGDIPQPLGLDDPDVAALVVEFAEFVGYEGATLLAGPAGASGLSRELRGTEVQAALAYLRGSRMLQKALIPGDFESIDGPVIVWSEQGVETALLAGRRQGVITEHTESVAALSLKMSWSIRTAPTSQSSSPRSSSSRSLQRSSPRTAGSLFSTARASSVRSFRQST